MRSNPLCRQKILPALTHVNCMGKSYIFIAIILLVLLCLIILINPISAKNQTVYVISKGYEDPNNYVYYTINEAVENVENGGVVIVGEGMYKENIQISKSLTLKGDFDKENNEFNSVIYNEDKNVMTIYVKCSSVTIENMSIWGGMCGIQSYRANWIKLIHNDIRLSNFYGVLLRETDGITINNNSISELKQREESVGIYLEQCDLGTVRDNEIVVGEDKNFIKQERSKNIEVFDNDYSLAPP